MKKKILIVGLGLIGSSLAGAIKKANTNVFDEIEIIGLDENKETENIALQEKIIDSKGISFEEEAPKADVIILSTPVKDIIKRIELLSQMDLKEDVLITDVGSTKREIMKVARLFGLKNFIGGHPMAGSHKDGVMASRSSLFEEAYYIIIPQESSKEEQIDTLKALLQGTKANFVVLSAEEHDEITGMLSHLPHIIAAGLINQSKEFDESHPACLKLAAGGFKDLTRIASSRPDLWSDILLTNKETILRLMAMWQSLMEKMSRWIQKDDVDSIYNFLEEARETREKVCNGNG